MQSTRIPIDKLHISEHNTRQPKPTDPAIKELAKSLKARQITPIVVRPHPDKAGHYEIAAGSRRTVAARLAGLDALDATVRDYDDQAFEEAILVDNLQREDPDPVAEAILLKRLVSKGIRTASTIAAHLGKSEKWAARRLTLANLSPEVLKEWKSGCLSHLSVSIMEAFASLPEDTQENLIHECFEDQYDPPSFTSRAEFEEFLSRELARLDVDWLNDPETFVEGCGPGCACPSDKTLFDIIAPKKGECATCLNPACFNQRKQLALEKQVRDLRQEYPKAIILSDYHVTIGDQEISPDYSHRWRLKPSNDGNSKPVIYIDRSEGASLRFLPQESASSSPRQEEKIPLSALPPEEARQRRIDSLQSKRWTLVLQQLQQAIIDAPYEKLTVPIDNLIAAFGLPFQVKTYGTPPDTAYWNCIYSHDQHYPTDSHGGNCSPYLKSAYLPREQALWPYVRTVLHDLIPTPRTQKDILQFTDHYTQIARLIKFPIHLTKRKADLAIPPPKSWGPTDPHTLQPITTSKAA